VQRERERRSLLKAEIERNVLLFVPMSLVVCGLWIAFLTYQNVRDRRLEMGTLMALGFRPRQLQALVLSKAVVIGLLGTVIGFVVGKGGMVLVKKANNVAAEWLGGAMFVHLAAALAVAVCLCVAGSSLPARVVANLDPADVLRGE
jgi:ABC-type antimicrobial peptide transport system permease subunit